MGEYTIQNLLEKIAKQNEVIDKLQKENIYRMGVQYAREEELIIYMEENKLLKSKLYWWQK